MREGGSDSNVKQAVTFLAVSARENSLRFYIILQSNRARFCLEPFSWMVVARMDVTLVHQGTMHLFHVDL